MMEVGVANPIAQGQAIIRTETPATNAIVTAGSGPNKNHAKTLSAEKNMTAGTNH
jgi:hypothetical protein